MSILKLANRNGIPCLDVQNISVTSTNVIFNFADHPLFRNNFQGIFLVRNTQTFTAPESALPIQFATTGVADSTINVTNVGGTNITSTQLALTGIYVMFYDRPTNTLQLLSRNS